MKTALNARGIVVVKANGMRESFDPDKLLASLLNSGATQAAAEEVLNHVAPEIHDGTSTDEIYKHAFEVLRNLNRPLARRYSLRRAVMDLGPTGFPFEDFVAEIFKAKGFNTLTRQTVLGGCVPHEVDVVAWNGKKLIMTETKFHNELGTKSDLKVALYVKARFDDLKHNVFSYGGQGRPLDEGWLITNTKFSSTALHYGVCQNLVMIGWNYPEQGSLQDMIESEALYPLTCLTSLSLGEKGLLMRSGVVLCKSLREDPQILKEALGTNFDSGPVISEINEL